MLVHELDLRYIYLTCLRSIGLFALALSYYIDFNFVAVAAAAAAAAFVASFLSLVFIFIHVFFCFEFHSLFSCGAHTQHSVAVSLLW